jgi:hypothetical protein
MSFDRFSSPVSHTFMPAQSRVSIEVPNPVPRADSFAIAVRS